jgi:hypothetical protein
LIEEARAVPGITSEQLQLLRLDRDLLENFATRGREVLRYNHRRTALKLA